MAKSKPIENTDPVRKPTASLEGVLNKDQEDNLPNIGGRPQAEINWDKVETCMAMGGDLKMCAAFGGVHWNTLERRIMERYKEGFKDVRQYFMTDRKALALKQIMNLVAKGNVRATIFINKAWNGMSDRPKDMGDDDESGEGDTFKLAYDPHEKPPVDAEYHQVANEE